MQIQNNIFEPRIELRACKRIRRTYKKIRKTTTMRKMRVNADRLVEQRLPWANGTCCCLSPKPQQTTDVLDHSSPPLQT